MPTTVMSGLTLFPLPKQNFMPIGLRPGKKRFATFSLITATFGAVALSASVNSRPLTSGTRNVEK